MELMSAHLGAQQLTEGLLSSVALFYSHSCFKMNIGFCPSSVYFLVFMEALPCVSDVYSSLVLVVFYFTGFIIFALLILVLKLLLQQFCMIFKFISKWPCRRTEMATFINEFVVFIVSYHHPKSGDKRIESGILWLWESNSRVLPYHRAQKLLAL